MTDGPARLTQPFLLAPSLRLNNRVVATAHGTGAVSGGAPTGKDIEYWRRLARGGSAMIVLGGGAVGPRGIRQANRTELWREEIVPALSSRAKAIVEAGSVPVLQLTDLGRETLGNETFFAIRSSSASRSPREIVAPRAMTELELTEMVDQFVVGGRHAAVSGHSGVELHAAHGYLLGQMLSPQVNGRHPGRLEEMRSVLAELIRRLAGLRDNNVVGVRLSVGDAEDAGLDIEHLAETLDYLGDLPTYINLTVGMRGTYVRDMGQPGAPLLGVIDQLRTLTKLPLLISHSFRNRHDIELALERGADLVGIARPLIADPDFTAKLIRHDDADIRPCVSCNEDCRTFAPSLLCSVNPSLTPIGETSRPAVPLVLRAKRVKQGRLGVIGAGPGGLESALTAAKNGVSGVVIWEMNEHIGGALALAASAPARHGWNSLIGFYAAQLSRWGVEVRLGTMPSLDDLGDFASIVVATGAVESPSETGWLTTTDFLEMSKQHHPTGTRAAVVDDGFGWWAGVGALEKLLQTAAEVTFVTPSVSFASGIPAESRVQLLNRLEGANIQFAIASTAECVAGVFGVRSNLSGKWAPVDADLVVNCGERRPLPDPLPFSELDADICVVGDAVVPRKASHAIAEGRAAGYRAVSALVGK